MNKQNKDNLPSCKVHLKDVKDNTMFNRKQCKCTSVNKTVIDTLHCVTQWHVCTRQPKLANQEPPCSTKKKSVSRGERLNEIK